MKTQYTKYHNKSFRHGGNLFTIVAHNLAARQLVSVVCGTNPSLSIDDLLKCRSKLATAIKNRIKMGLVG